MYDIECRNVGYALITDVSHGQARLKGKVDSGSPISVFNLSAVSVFTGMSAMDLRNYILNSKAPMNEFKGYNGISSNIYLAAFNNIRIGSYMFSNYYAGISLDYPIGKDGYPMTKILIGMDVINSCEGVLTTKGISLNVKREEQQQQRMLKAFNADKEKVITIDEAYES